MKIRLPKCTASRSMGVPVMDESYPTWCCRASHGVVRRWTLWPCYNPFYKCRNRASGKPGRTMFLAKAIIALSVFISSVWDSGERRQMGARPADDGLSALRPGTLGEYPAIVEKQ